MVLATALGNVARQYQYTYCYNDGFECITMQVKNMSRIFSKIECLQDNLAYLGYLKTMSWIFIQCVCANHTGLILCIACNKLKLIMALSYQNLK
jgi:hypothetical protein